MTPEDTGRGYEQRFVGTPQGNWICVQIAPELSPSQEAKRIEFNAFLKQQFFWYELPTFLGVCSNLKTPSRRKVAE